MVINVLHYVPQCCTWDDGAVIAKLIKDGFDRHEKVTVSMAGVNSAPSSFINAAFISLLDAYSLGFIKANLSVVDSTRQINDLIKRRFHFEVSRSVAA